MVCRKRRHRSVGARHLSNESKDVLKSYFGADVVELTRDPVAKHLCNDHCDTCNWHKYEPRQRLDYFRTAIADRELKHAIDTWKGRLQRELVDLSAKKDGKPPVCKPTTGAFLEKIKERGDAIARGDLI